MLRRDIVWTAVLYWVLVGSPRMFADEQSWLADAPHVDAEAWLILQPGEGSSSAETTRSATPRSSARSSYARLARAPNMFGDSFGNTGQLAVKGTVLDANGELKEVLHPRKNGSSD